MQDNPIKLDATREEIIDDILLTLTVSGLKGVTTLYGDLQGIAGKSLQEIEDLELKTLDFEEDSEN